MFVSTGSPGKKINFGQAFMVALFIVVGFLCGEAGAALDAGNDSFAVFMVELFAGLLGGICLNIAIHEAGHLVCGLISGYSFVSYRVGPFMLLREGGKLRLKLLSIAGTGGQCLMRPHARSDGKYPFILYNLGGALFNIIFGAAFASLAFMAPMYPPVRVIFAEIGIVGIGYALVNGIPMRVGLIDNDGMNAITLAKSPAARRSFITQLEVTAASASGVRLKDMPEEWFATPEDGGERNALSAAIDVFRENRLMDAHALAEAGELARRLIADPTVSGLHRQLLICDLACLEYLDGHAAEADERLSDKIQQNFMKAMKNFPSVIRTEYFASVLGGGKKEPSELREKFEKTAKTYPYPTDVDSERELMALVDKKASDKSL